MQLVSNIYGDLGQLTSKKVGNNLQTVEYDYNVRGWLTGINKNKYSFSFQPSGLGSSLQKLFVFNIHYNTPQHGATPLFNGNISETEWKTANDNTQRWYKYSYDALNRITSGISDNTNYNLGLVTYDKNGNIKELERNGYRDINVTSFGLMDKLAYSYQGNQLLAVDDAPTASAVTGFVDGAETAIEYVYDANGNMISDANKGIIGITYNHLNLPETVTINNAGHTGTISYIYDATGAKIKKVATEGSSLIHTEYAGNYVYKNGNLEFFNHPEGIVEHEADGYKYVYQFKDHLGNIRLSYKDADKDGTITTSEIVEVKDYYPFGMQLNYGADHPNSRVNGRKHNYGFNGVELEENLGLDLYEMDFRKYDPAIARWTGIDPVTHYSLSPYNAFDNNPVYWADPSGANSTAEWMASNGITDDDLITVYSADDYSPDNNVTVNSKTKKAEISENDDDYDTVVTDGEISYAPKGSSKSYLESEGYTVKDLEGVGMGAVDNSILILSSEAVFAWTLRGIKGVWAAWAARGTSKLDNVSGIVLQRSEQLSILGGNAGKWPWKRTTASIAELTAGGGNCLACARKIQEAIGGRIINIVDNFGAPGIGPMYNKAGKLISRDFKIHHAVRKGDMIFDRVTGPSGMNVDNYKKLFEYGKYLNFK